MSAREALIRSVYALKNMSQNDMEKLVDAYAHELAEKIRAETQQLKDDGVLEPDRFRPCRDAADQIDPEVSDGWDTDRRRGQRLAPQAPRERAGAR